MSSPELEPAETAAVLTRKAQGDAKAMKTLAADAEIDDESVVRQAIGLTEYAVPLRYEDLLDAEPLDREATVALVEKVGRWAEEIIGR